MSWWNWVVKTSGTESPKTMQAKTGIDGPNFSKWKAGQVPRAETVAKFARGYNVPVLSAFVAAGFLTEKEARMRPAAAPSLDSLSDDELVDQIRERLRKAGEQGGRDAPSMKLVPEDEQRPAARTLGQAPSGVRTEEEQAADLGVAVVRQAQAKRRPRQGDPEGENPGEGVTEA